jgi:hypothetical protein
MLDYKKKNKRRRRRRKMLHSVVQGCTDFTETYKTPQNSRCQKYDMKQVTY